MRRSPRLRRAGRILAAVAGVAFAYIGFVYLTLPDVRPLRTTPPETTAFMELRAREARAGGVEPKRAQRWIPYARISPQLVRAVLVTEDAAFWQHAGVDYQQIRESMEVNLERGEFARGASTITQQLAKNLYLSPSKNPVRKIRELMIARRLEHELPKRRILELYLNVIEWGDGIYGAEAAARTYFGKPASQLTASESALLAAAIANPRVMNPGRPSTRLRRRQQMVMRRMGAVEPPPVVAGKTDDESGADTTQPVPPLIEPGLPAHLPGQVVLPPGGRGGGASPEPKGPAGSR